MCGPLIEILAPAQAKDNPSDEDDDMSPESTVQLLHQTVKDFLVDPELAGPFFFTKHEESIMWHCTLDTYLIAVLPNRPTAYAPLPTGDTGNWNHGVELTAAYLSNERLLPKSSALYPHPI